MSTEVQGCGKGPEGRWIDLTDAVVYFDHPQHSTETHALIIDLLDKPSGPGGRVAIELNVASARRLVDAIEQAMAAVDPAILANS